ncbi:MAG: biopolymer transporter ExbD [Burkholderiaceae bacterium]|jgi:biopolymer transport protein ExbD|nr:biopolymer transporter ExbD [Burkholderiaceae bacterium]MEB2353387.1 biopolymer transporter ExbD [Burkholderiaceae bacterium]
MKMGDGEIDEINVVPLVDVMLVLLTIVLTTATFVVNGRIPIDLARAAAVEPAHAAPLVLSLTHEQRLFLNDVPVGDLAAALGSQPRSQPIVVRADGRLALSQFVELVDRVRAMGFERVSLEVRRA